MDYSLEHYIKEVPLFKGANHQEICDLLKEYDVKKFNPGDYICRQGEYDENCNIILDGSVSVIIPQADSDMPLKIKLGKGEIFGEIAAMSGTPRTADVVADTQARLLNISRDKLFKLLDVFPVIKERLDATYRSRALTTHLANIPIFAGLTKPFLEQLRDKVSLLTFKAGEVIFKQGMEADSFYLIRYGFVKVMQADAKGSEKIIAYLNEGHYFGEIALLGDEKRSATVEALNRLELIKIAKDDFNAILEQQPAVKTALQKVVQKRLDRNLQMTSSKTLSNSMSAAVEAGVIQSKAVLIMDISKCVQCDNCVNACAALHDGHSHLIRKGIKFNDFILLPTSCRNCQDPICMSKCPTGAIQRDLTGEIYHKDNCIGCGGCARLCPHGNISIITLEARQESKSMFAPFLSAIIKKMHAAKPTRAGEEIKLPEVKDKNPAKAQFPGERMMVERPDAQKLPGERDMFTAMQAATVAKTGVAPQRAKRKAAKCDMCRNYDFMGCVYNCPTGAARRVDPTEFFADLRTFG